MRWRYYTQMVFYKIKTEHIPGAHLKFYTCFYYMPLQNILKQGCKPLAFTSYKAFLKKKKTSRIIVSLSHVMHDF